MAVALILSILKALGADKGGRTIAGIVVGSGGKPLVGSTVSLVGHSVGTTTNEKGAFVLRNIKEGSYKLKVSYLGFKTQELGVELTQNVNLNVTLEAQSLLGDEVVVSATRAAKRTPMAFTDLKAYEIRRNSTGGDVAQIFELTPSFVATTESGIGIGNTAFSIRGTDASRINITVDGFPINDPESQQVFFVNMPDIASSATSVQIQRGVGTSTNGAGAFGATVNFQTGALSSEPYAELNSFLGSYGSWRGNFLVGSGIVNNRFSFDARISRAKSDGYVDRASSDHKAAQLSGTYYGKRSSLKATFIYGEEHTGISWTGVPSSIIDTNRTYNKEGIYFDSKGVRQVYDNQTDNYKQLHHLLNYTSKLTDKLTLNLGLFFTHGEGYYENMKDDAKFSKYGLSSVVVDNVTKKKGDFVVQKWLDNDNVGSTFSLVFSPLQSLSFTLGGSASRFTNDHFGKIKWAEFSNGIPADYEWYRSKSTKDDANSFLKLSWQPSDKLNVFADMQYRYVSYKMKGLDDDRTDITQDHRFDFFNPKLGVYYTFNEQNSVFASFSVANREPTRSDYTDSFKSDKKLTSERMFDYEVGYKHTTSDAAFGVNLYYMHYKDQLVLTGKLNNVGYPIRENAPSSYRRGVELMAATRISDFIKWEGNLTLSENKIKNFTYSVELYDNPNDWNFVKMNEYSLGTSSISFSPNVIGASMLTFEPIKGFKVDLTTKYVGKQYYDNSESSKRMLKAYLVNNLRAGYELTFAGVKNIQLQVGVNNLFNEKYIANAWIYRAEFQDGTEFIDDGLFPQATRNYWARVSVRF
jgi:iron complex outermembrane receptor protein